MLIGLPEAPRLLARSATADWQYELMNRLNASGNSGTAQSRTPEPPQSNGQISGHVYRADNGKPLSRIIVTLDPSGRGTEQSQRTIADGSYRFSNVASGNYWVTAYGTGFVGSIYRRAKATSTSNNLVSSCPPDCVTLLSGQVVNNIDLRLISDPPITSLDKQLASLFPGVSDHLNPGVGRFSPDGKYFAIAFWGTSPSSPAPWQVPGGVFLYNPTSEVLKQIATNGGELAWGADDTLYMQGINYIAATISGASVTTRTITDFPDEIKAAFRQGLNGDESNDQYDVTSPRLCRGCAFTLTAKRTDGSGEQVIADIENGFIFDGKNSVVLYPDGNEIVSYRLATEKSQKTTLPVEALDLIDQTHEGSGHLVAYYANAPCEPDAASEETESKLLVPNNARLRRQQAPAIQVCFVKIP